MWEGLPDARYVSVTALVKSDTTIEREKIDEAKGIGAGVEIIRIASTEQIDENIQGISYDHNEGKIPSEVTADVYPGTGVPELLDQRSAFNTIGYKQLFVCDDFPVIKDELIMLKLSESRNFEMRDLFTPGIFRLDIRIGAKESQLGIYNLTITART